MPNKSAINLIEAEIAALNALLKTLDEAFDSAVDHIVNCSGKIIVIGIGKSGHVGNKMAAKIIERASFNGFTNVITIVYTVVSRSGIKIM